jgi:hypothetical protein
MRQMTEADLQAIYAHREFTKLIAGIWCACRHRLWCIERAKRRV